MKKDLGICLIGCGRAGMIHAGNFSSRVPGAKMVAVADVVEEAARSAADKLGISAWYTDYREALLNPAVDAVVVVSPTDLHKSIVIDSANAGKHVFCEKPMAMNTAECQEMIDACEEASNCRSGSCAATTRALSRLRSYWTKEPLVTW